MFPMVGRLNPRVFPPTNGTQSGISTCRLLTFPMIQLMPSMRPLSSPMMPLMGILTMETSPSQTPEKMLFIPSQALLQSPEKTPPMKSTIPWNTFLMLFQTFLTLARNPLITSPKAPNFSDQSVEKIPVSQSSNFRNTPSAWSMAFGMVSVKNPTIASQALEKASWIASQRWIQNSRNSSQLFQR